VIEAELLLVAVGRGPVTDGLGYAEQGIEIVTVRRGGLLTYHGPGQLVGYPVVRVEEVRPYVEALEQVLVSALADEGVAAHARPADGPAYMGVWIDDERKIASVGVHVSQHVTTHGFALNVDNDMRPWEWATACGLPGVRMTSIADERSMRSTRYCDMVDFSAAPRTTMRTSSSDSSVRRWPSLLPRRSPRSTSGASDSRRVMVVASLNAYRSRAQSTTRVITLPAWGLAAAACFCCAGACLCGAVGAGGKSG